MEKTHLKWNKLHFKAVCIWLCTSGLYALNFPAIDSLKLEFLRESLREPGKIQLEKVMGKEVSILVIRLDGKKIKSHRYIKSKGFSDYELTQLAKKYGQGGTWHEMSLSYDTKKEYSKALPGIEQHWQLQGFNSQTGWMASGLEDNQFWICFMENSPVEEKKPAGPFALNSELYQNLKKSGIWLEIECPGNYNEEICFKSIINSQIDLRIHKQKPIVYSVLKENNDLPDVEAALKSLTKAEFFEYSKDLEGLSESEGQSAIFKFAEAIPELFNWTGPQIQKAKIGIIPAAIYLEKFKTAGPNWEAIPLFKTQLKNSTVTIELDYNGNYHLTVK